VNRGGVPFRVLFHGGWYLDIDLEQRDHLTAFDLQSNPVGIHGDVLVDGSQNIFMKNGDKIGVAAGASFMHQQDLQSMMSGGCRSLPTKQIRELHAALRPNSFPNSVTLSLGTTSGTCSPRSLRAASL
jgi:hypothetical protein